MRYGLLGECSLTIRVLGEDSFALKRARRRQSCATACSSSADLRYACSPSTNLRSTCSASAVLRTAYSASAVLRSACSASAALRTACSASAVLRSACSASAVSTNNVGTCNYRKHTDLCTWCITGVVVSFKTM